MEFPSCDKSETLTLFDLFCCSVAKSCLTLCNPMDCSTPGFPFLHYLLEFAQTRVDCVSYAIQPSHPLLLLSPPALSLFDAKIKQEIRTSALSSENAMAPHSSTLAWKIPWMEEPGRL